MSRKPSFPNLRTHTPTPAAPEAKPDPAPVALRAAKAGSRSPASSPPEMSFAMHMLARRQGRSVQALMAEAFDDVLRKYRETLVGE